MIKSGQMIWDEWVTGRKLDIAKQIDTQLREILSVIKPILEDLKICGHVGGDVDDFNNLVAELEVIQEAHGKDTAD